MIRAALQSGHPYLEGITLERLEREPFVRLNVGEPFLPYAEGAFDTASGKLAVREAGVCGSGRIARGRSEVAREVSAGDGVVEERSQHELDVRVSRGGG